VFKRKKKSYGNVSLLSGYLPLVQGNSKDASQLWLHHFQGKATHKVAFKIVVQWPSAWVWTVDSIIADINRGMML
jgi:hypothetical protein